MNLKLPPVSPTGPQEALARQTREDGSGSGGGIGQNFEKLLQQVNQQQLTAEAKQVELLTAENKDIHGTMIALEKADISMRLMLQIRNKLVSAYEEVMRCRSDFPSKTLHPDPFTESAHHFLQILLLKFGSSLGILSLLILDFFPKEWICLEFVFEFHRPDAFFRPVTSSSPFSLGHHLVV